jgi:uncharacterized protein with HEPN domain
MTGDRCVDYLEHMLEAAQQVQVYVADMDIAEFLADKRTQQAVVMNLIIIGEAATKLLHDHESFLDQFSAVPWRSMKGMRNRIAHGYFDIDLAVVWDTVTTALPELAAQLPSVLQAAKERPSATK